MNFFCITKKTNSVSVLLLKKSCKERGLKFVNININTHDFTKKIDTEGHIVYRIATGEVAREVERHIVRDRTITFYKKNERVLMDYQETAIFEKNNLATPKTIPSLPMDEKLLEKYAKNLGGFPLVVKILGKSHGLGVYKVDSLSELINLSNKLNKIEGGSKIVMKEFININYHARLIVLGNKVIGEIEYIAKGDEFRTNLGNPIVKMKEFSPEVKKTAIEAVKMLDIEFGGVDILVDCIGNHYVAEVNFPCFFPRCQETTGRDISGMMVDFLINKNK